MQNNEQINLKELWVDNTYDLSTHHNCETIESLPATSFVNNTAETTLIRPRSPLAAKHNRQLAINSPKTLRHLFNVACRDMRRIGLNPDAYKVYPLFQSGWVEPTKALRANFWHFDLMRNLRLPVPDRKMAFTIGYSVMNTLPTMFASNLQNEHRTPLPARRTIQNQHNHLRLGELALQENRVTSPFDRNVIRYDSMTLHKGRPNTSSQPVYRVFANLSFSR